MLIDMPTHTHIQRDTSAHATVEHLFLTLVLSQQQVGSRSVADIGVKTIQKVDYA